MSQTSIVMRLPGWLPAAIGLRAIVRTGVVIAGAADVPAVAAEEAAGAVDGLVAVVVAADEAVTAVATGGEN